MHRSSTSSKIVTICLLAMPFIATPARAGHYQLANTSPLSNPIGNGVITRQPGSTTQLSSPNISELGANYKVAYGYSETYTFEWVPNSGQTVADDPPLDQIYSLEWTGGLNASVSNISSASGSYKGSLTVSCGSNSQQMSATLTATPNGAGGHIVTSDGLGSQTWQLAFTLVGVRPQISVDYAGEMEVDGPVTGSLVMSRNPVPSGKFIVIDALSATKPNPFLPPPYNTTVSVSGR
jgi:hypothetical protein